MILYDFYCKKCNKVFDSLEPSGTKEIVCQCGKKAIKVLSPSHFKINGYSEANGYSNDKKPTKVNDGQANRKKKNTY